MELFDRIRGLLGGKDAPAAQTVTVKLTAAAPGTAMTVAALGLPNVEPIIARETDEDPDYNPNVAWLIDKPKDGKALWTRLVSEFPTTGLWPVVADGLYGDINRPWRDGELSGPSAEIVDAEAVLLNNLADMADDEASDHEPWRNEMGPMSTATREAGPIDLPVPFEVDALLLVPVTRPADVPAQLGWLGPINYDLRGCDVSAVLRSWEDRFGAVLVALGFDALTLHVDAPPVGENATRAAHEWYAFCPDSIDQGVGSMEALTEAVHDNTWWFWWD